jgi:hypothetical protein
MAMISCPRCGLESTYDVIRKSYDEFCRRCDYPLFWAPSVAPVGAAVSGSDAALRRLPGASGRSLIGTKDCWNCGELNASMRTLCVRCGVSLEKPVEQEEPEPEPVVLFIPPPPTPQPEKGWRWWMWALLLLAIAIIVVTVVVLVND